MKYILCLLIAINLSCSSKHEHEEAIKVYDESMKIHDEIMPHMDELFLLRQQLSHKIDSLKADSVVNNAVVVEMRAALEDLEMADEAMMDWMHNTQIVPGSTTESHHNQHQSPEATSDEVLSVQKNQLSSIKKIQKDAGEAIEKAKQLLDTKYSPSAKRK